MAILLALACLAATLCAGAEGAKVPFDYEALNVTSDMPLCYNYRYNNADGSWNSGVVTMGDDSYLMFMVLGDSGTDTLSIQLNATDCATDAECEALEIGVDGTVYAFSLSDIARERGLSGFWIYSTSFPLVEALAQGRSLKVAAVFGGEKRIVETGEEELEALNFICGQLVAQDALAHLNPDTFNEENLPVLDALLGFSAQPGEVALEVAPTATPTAAPVLPAYDSGDTWSGGTSGGFYNVIDGMDALEKAKLYVEIMGISRQGLIDQLEFDGYGHAEAVSAADSCGADWYRQAARSASQYLEIFDMSRSELIDQLEFDGYTYDEAVYGADHG